MNITLTGVDIRTPADVIHAVQSYGAEVGLLYSATNNSPRFMPRERIVNLTTVIQGKYALHICGRLARNQLHSDLLSDIVGGVQRIQVNGPITAGEIISLCAQYPTHTIITQSSHGNPIFSELANHAVLQDESGGRGILPTTWERPETTRPCGFAGGLSPDNLDAQLPRIAAVAVEPTWIDIETGLRTDGWFDKYKAIRALEIYDDFARDSP